MRPARLARVCGAGAIGGAFCGFAIMQTQQLINHDVGPVTVASLTFDATIDGIAAIFGAAFGLLSFPICYFLICGDVPLRRLMPYVISATIVGQLVYTNLLPDFGGPIEKLLGTLNDEYYWFFWVDIYAGGLVGLLAACIVLRLIHDGTQTPSFARPTTSS